jgi:hypothetical protein
MAGLFISLTDGSRFLFRAAKVSPPDSDRCALCAAVSFFFHFGIFFCFVIVSPLSLLFVYKKAVPRVERGEVPRLLHIHVISVSLANNHHQC